MRLHSITIKNVRSFKEETTITFDEHFNILIGPNGSGKSNLLDIINIILQEHILYSYQIDYLQFEAGLSENISKSGNSFGNLSKTLEKFSGDNSEMYVKVSLKVTKEDILNVKLVKAEREKIRGLYTRYQQIDRTVSSYVDSEEPFDVITEGQDYTFTIREYRFEQPPRNTPESAYLSYLRAFKGLILLTRNSDIALRPNIVFVSPFRNAGPENLQTTLANQTYIQELRNIANVTSKSSMSLISMASTFFGEKRRKLEADFGADRNAGWNSDEDVIAVRKYLERIGYNWSLDLIDPNKNIYEIKLERNGKKYLLSHASAGEIEMINYIFGLHALKLESGLIIIDEPELHLHPKWIRLLLDVFMELSNRTGNQFLISTHSPIFINEDSYTHIIRVYKDRNDVSRCVSMLENPELNIKDALHIVNSTNNEKMFFADAVVMVEGITDRLVFQKIFEEIKTERNLQKTIEIIEIHGKSNRDKFGNFLKMLSIPSFFIGDLDNINQLSANEKVKSLFVCHEKKIKEDVVDNPKSMDGKELTKYIDEAINTSNLEHLKNVWEYILSTRTKLKEPLSAEESNALDTEVNNLCAGDNCLLRDGDIEDYFPEGFRRKDLNNVIKLLSDVEFLKWRASDDYKKLHELAGKIVDRV